MNHDGMIETVQMLINVRELCRDYLYVNIISVTKRHQSGKSIENHETMNS